jgi:hypothetical protein
MGSGWCDEGIPSIVAREVTRNQFAAAAFNPLILLDRFRFLPEHPERHLADRV